MPEASKELLLGLRLYGAWPAHSNPSVKDSPFDVVTLGSINPEHHTCSSKAGLTADRNCRGAVINLEEVVVKPHLSVERLDDRGRRRRSVHERMSSHPDAARFEALHIVFLTGLELGVQCDVEAHAVLRQPAHEGLLVGRIRFKHSNDLAVACKSPTRL